MCEIMTVITAVAFTMAYIIAAKKNRPAKSFFTATLMFWGAALMWLVDCITSALSGEGFFDLSREDSILGLLIVGAGLLVWGILYIIEKSKTQLPSPKQS